jgi:transcriptional regulator with XRE-family HTH domain
MPGRRSTSTGDFSYVDVHVGARLRHRREQLGLSQMRLAAALDISHQLIQKYERGACRIWIYRLYCFAKILKVEVGWFFDGLTPLARGRVAIIVPEQKLQNRETTLLAQAYLRLAPERRRAVLRLIQSITGTPAA